MATKLEDLAGRLYYQRLRRGLSQADAARLIGTSTASLSRVERATTVRDVTRWKVQTWLDDPERSIHCRRLELLASDLAEVPRGLDQLALRRLPEILDASRSGQSIAVKEWADGLVTEWESEAATSPDACAPTDHGTLRWLPALWQWFRK